MKINLNELKKKHKKLTELDIETLTSLIEAAQSGDKKAENYLFKIVGEHYHRTLLVPNIEDAEDIIQNALLSLYTSYRNFKILPKKFRGLVRVALKMKYIRFYDKSIKYLNKMDRYTYNLKIIANNQYSPIKKLEIKEQLKKVNNEIIKLPERDRKILMLYLNNDLSYADIGKKLNYTRGSICASMNTTRKILRQKCQEYRLAV